jgi:GNAT superfamily N-acetyltransferase
MYQPLNGEDVEVKRVYVSDRARGMGAGIAISRILIEQARADGFRRVLLDTSRQFVHAQRLYEKLGFAARGPYSDLPEGYEEYLVFYELTL